MGTSPVTEGREELRYETKCAAPGSPCGVCGTNLGSVLQTGHRCPRVFLPLIPKPWGWWPASAKDASTSPAGWSHQMIQVHAGPGSPMSLGLSLHMLTHPHMPAQPKPARVLRRVGDAPSVNETQLHPEVLWREGSAKGTDPVSLGHLGDTLTPLYSTLRTAE